MMTKPHSLHSHDGTSVPSPQEKSISTCLFVENEVIPDGSELYQCLGQSEVDLSPPQMTFQEIVSMSSNSESIDYSYDACYNSNKSNVYYCP